jgi:hypothetical protein
MTQGKNKTSSSFTEIKQRLDPDCSYVIFEKTIKSQKNKKFEEVHAVLSQIKKGILNQETHQDVKKKQLYLVVKLDPNQTEGIIEVILTIKLPEDITFYIYKSSRKH